MIDEQKTAKEWLQEAPLDVFNPSAAMGDDCIKYIRRIQNATLERAALEFNSTCPVTEDRQYQIADRIRNLKEPE